MEVEQAIKFIKHSHLLKNEATVWADFGAGTGLFTHGLAHLLAPGSKILAVDKREANFDAKITRSSVDIQFIQADFDSNEFRPDDLLDGILMANSLHFVAAKEAFLQSSKRHFKGNQCFLIIEYDLSVPNPWVPFPISFKSLRRLLTSTGFSFVEKIHEAPSRFNKSNIYSLIAMGDKV